MKNRIRQDYRHTVYASYTAYVCQAVINNFAPLLFLTFASDYGLGLSQITLITTVNFLVQLLVDLLSARVLDYIGYRRAIIGGHLLAFAGITGLAVFPGLLGNAYGGILLAVILYAIGGGVMEVLVSPIVEACPTDEKAGSMSLLHSFYCWGHLAVVLLSTAFFQAFGIENWRILAFFWALLPLCNSFYFSQVPIFPIAAEGKTIKVRRLLQMPLFWLILGLMVCAGASEQAMSQWASAFAESALQVSKTVGDLAGPCAFALLMGASRYIYGKYSERIPLIQMMAGSAVLCVLCYGLAAWSGNALLALFGCSLCGFSVGIFWPGTFSIGARLLPGGGTAMYALMALAGDIGCSAGPTVVGFVADSAGGNLLWGLSAAIGFPLLMLLGIGLLRRKEGRLLL